MVHRSRLTRSALAAAILLVSFASCAKQEAAAPVVEAEPAPAAEAPAAAMQAAPPPPQAAANAAVTTINLSNCEITGNKGSTTIIDWQPTDPSLPVEVDWTKQGNGQGLKVVIKPLTGPGEQSPNPGQQKKILEMFDPRYEIGLDQTSVRSKLPKNPPFEPGAKDVRWKYQVQVVNAQGKVICGVDPDVCVRLPGGCST